LTTPNNPDPQEWFDAVICLLLELLDRFPQDYTKLPIETLSGITKKKGTEARVQAAIEGILTKEQAAREKLKKSIVANSKTPEDIKDYKSISVFPSAAEIIFQPGDLRDRLRRNIVEGKYDNVLHYLDVHFRLLREDCVASIRDGIIKYRANTPMGIECVLYTNVKVVGIQCSNIGIVYRISFDIDMEVNWACSKKLIYGSLLCLSPDNFQTVMWATVAQRDAELLRSKQHVDIRFPEGYVPNFANGGGIFTMVESTSTYFEAYRHVLTALQSIEFNKFPFTKYLINLETSVKQPSYLSSMSCTYNLESILEGGVVNFPILGKWPDLAKPDEPANGPVLQSTMDDSQLDALKRALTREFALIQGPPGTGKTFVGLKVMKALLANAELRGKSQGPILVICFTNHALDQFLEGIFDFEESVVRIGGRSQSEKLKDRNLKELLYESDAVSRELKKARRELTENMRELEAEIAQCLTDLKKLNLSREDLSTLCHSQTQLETLYSKHKLSDILKVLPDWLETPDLRSLFVQATPPTKQEAGKKGPTLNATVEVEADEEEIIQTTMERMIDEDPDKKEVVAISDDIPISFSDIEQLDKSTRLNITQAYDLWDLSKPQRLLLYKIWLKEYKETKGRDLVGLCKNYEQTSEQKAQNDIDSKVAVLNDAKVIGMTTTGVAKFNKVIHRVQPNIIIVEEAAEVLESHIITALSATTKHLILIGDHEQLRPKTAVYALTKDFQLDVSLFERMVKNKVEHTTLLRQRRMRPEISKLLNVIYPALYDHPHVETYPNIRGVKSNLYFLTHTVPESQGGEEMSLSKSNLHEAQFIAQFCRYLMLQGYQSSQITVLTAYAGQVRMLRSEIRKLEPPEGSIYSGIDKVYITSVDNYQGEENDIILLSLVRSNPKKIIGFLNTSNRICVALSRARQGMYIVGNGYMLSEKNDVWNAIIEVMSKGSNFGTQLVLQCQNHKSTSTPVSCANDFKNVEDGGCKEKCGMKLPCGHPCRFRCHPYDHSQIRCNQVQKTIRECGHTVTHPCSEELGPCEEEMERPLPCGHTIPVPCYFTTWDNITCKAPCMKSYPCGHKCQLMCGEKCAKKCKKLSQRQLDCGHFVEAECSSNLVNFVCHLPHDNNKS